jgi:ectoine hydroxylase-related dioxygenase (phytanoyl-CoA dioxygenase family)
VSVHSSPVDWLTLADGLKPDYPLTTQVISQMLTLQCAIAHTPQPLEKGPTRFMPFSNHFAKGYIAVKSAEYYQWVSPRMSQMPLEVGDAVFFNPATFHQPGVNPAEEHRSMNLFQVNSCMSRSMESKNTLKMTKALWPVLQKWAEDCPDFAVHAKESGECQIQRKPTR